MRWRPRLLIVGARRGVPVALVVAVAHALGYMGRTSAWQGIWAETVAHWNSAAILSMPAAASMAAWLSAANRRDALARLESVASRSPWVVRLRTWAEVSCWVVLGLVMGCAPGVVMTFRRATFGSLDVTACAPVVAFVLSGVALGLLAGHVVPWTLGAPLIGVVTYVFFGVMDAGAHSLTQVVTPIDGRWMTYHRTSPSLLVARTALWLLVTAALLARWGGRARSALLLTWLAGIAAAPLLFVGSGDRVVVEPAAELRCAQTEGQVEVCLTASKSYLVPSLSKHAQQVFDTVEGLIDAPLRIVGDEARGLSYSTDEQIQELLIPGESGSVYAMSAIYDLSAAAEADRNAFLGGFAAVLFPDSPGREQADLPESMDAEWRPEACPVDVLTRWYFDRLDLSLDGEAFIGAPLLSDDFLDFTGPASEALGWFTDLDAQTRAEWFVEHRADVNEGVVQWEDFGEGG